LQLARQPGSIDLLFLSILSVGLLCLGALAGSRNFSLRSLMFTILFIGAAGICGLQLDRFRSTTGYYYAEFEASLSREELEEMKSELTFGKGPRADELKDCLIYAEGDDGRVVFPSGMEMDARTRIGKLYQQHFEKVTSEFAARKGLLPIEDSKRTTKTVDLEHP
jgi:hypothetical protein